MPLSCWVSTWAEFKTAVRAEDDSGVVDRACRDVMKSLKPLSSVDCRTRSAERALQPVVELGAQVGVAGA